MICISCLIEFTQHLWKNRVNWLVALSTIGTIKLKIQIQINLFVNYRYRRRFLQNTTLKRSDSRCSVTVKFSVVCVRNKDLNFSGDQSVTSHCPSSLKVLALKSQLQSMGCQGVIVIGCYHSFITSGVFYALPLPTPFEIMTWRNWQFIINAWPACHDPFTKKMEIAKKIFNIYMIIST